ncbi:Histidine phosphatase superfamily (branch 1) [Pseudovibrio axinellae]|uniref:Histidine phosphatase superfamily (Branch 1) n=1 Tax=Pseudovibrio axinellae TaxID=989403 RepID=A0A166A168_9HYPH|nr:histidine phosphatase family protein [Pseudovibrio axinellae]KZL20512.1 Histidine phosphatase superfamily (branch 1) [Pseudovibrio axinellae]SEQ36035.1 Broad specificity phosphatase PhoE [Pseudovibrio axinellae]
MTYCIYLSHPNVDIDPATPVPHWDLSDKGRARLEQGLRQPWLLEIEHVISSKEKKAIETGQIIASHLGIELTTALDLHENDRSATGFLPPEEFERVADEFFSRPAISVRGWERALDAQSRVIAAIQSALQSVPQEEPVLFSGHGAVGTLLKCHLANRAVAREFDQPAKVGGGCWFRFDRVDLEACSADINKLGWQLIDQVALVS